MKNIISLGAGVQSSVLALMAEKGLIHPRPDAAIFADTGAEPQAVYRWLDTLEKYLTFPVYRVSKGNLTQDILNAFKIKRFASVPFYTESRNKAGKIVDGMLRRQCTREYKVEPITKKIRELMGLKHRQRALGKIEVCLWIGISTDEAARMKPNREGWINNRWPLIELDMSRADCLTWMRDHGYPEPVKSSCTFCPYHDDLLWRDMKKDQGEEWAEATKIDEAIRNGVRGTKQRLFLHSSLKPLADVDFDTLEDKGQLNLFNNECEGMCGI